MSQPVTVDAAAAAPLSCTRVPSHGWRTGPSVVTRLALSHALPPPRPPSRLWHCHCITTSLDGYALLIYLTVPLCLCVLCGHPSQPDISCWLTCESMPLASWALATIVTISRYRRGLSHDIAILKKSTIWALRDTLVKNIQTMVLGF